jgi:cathepsin X
LIKVKEFSFISGAADMKKEIYARGPIACGIDATTKFDAYTGGVYQEFTWPEINHIISIIGWGKAADGTEYWIGRNSWGTYWGEGGFFRIVVGSEYYNLAVETFVINCPPLAPSPRVAKILCSCPLLTFPLLFRAAIATGPPLMSLPFLPGLTK